MGLWSYDLAQLFYMYLFSHCSCAEDGSTIRQVLMRNACFLTFTDDNWDTEQSKTLVATVDNIKEPENQVATFKVMATLLVNGNELHSMLVKEYTVSPLFLLLLEMYLSIFSPRGGGSSGITPGN